MFILSRTSVGVQAEAKKNEHNSDKKQDSSRVKYICEHWEIYSFLVVIQNDSGEKRKQIRAEYIQNLSSVVMLLFTFAALLSSTSLSLSVSLALSNEMPKSKIEQTQGMVTTVANTRKAAREMTKIQQRVFTLKAFIYRLQ